MENRIFGKFCLLQNYGTRYGVSSRYTVGMWLMLKIIMPQFVILSIVVSVIIPVMLLYVVENFFEQKHIITYFQRSKFLCLFDLVVILCYLTKLIKYGE